MFRKYKNLKEFNKYLKKYKKKFAILIIVMVLASSLGMILPFWYSKRLVGITELNREVVIIYSVVIIVTILFHHIFWYLWEKIASKLTNKISFDIRENIIQSLLNTRYLIIKNNSSGYYLERIKEDVGDVACVVPKFLGTIVDAITNFSFLIYISIINFRCGLVFSIGILVLYSIDVLKIKKNIKYTEQLKVYEELFNTRINEIYTGIKDIKGLGIKEILEKDTNIISKKITDLQISKDSTIAILSRMKTFSQYFLEAILILYSVIYLIPTNNFSVIGLLMVLSYSGFMYELVGYIANMKDCLENGEYKAGRILEIIDKSKLEKFGIIETTTNSIEIKDLSYKYSNTEKLILENINISIKPNTISLFIGKSGNGKTTLFSILYKLLNVENGKVFIGGKDINKLSEKYFKENVCVVNQEPFLLNDSIINNLRLVNENADLSQIYNACQKVNIHKEILKMKDGYNTIISENGNNLSGGQKQRLAIARAIIKNSTIIIFDEPTSALDKENQKIFFEVIQELKKTKTILIIAHKYEMINSVDNVLELKNGNLIKSEFSERI